ncbi:ParA family protein [Bergeyella zoohelcum]|uniref:CobQ/CobB/MinD/ParA nucleotide binding domain-containing protein n=2 Tax=Bergeyella zoohelcum TaxID=1015 RepID=K1LC13_9FLAO|nr:ParA family protein [Bergeyella zoohelcum]EKB54135.1 hypothetical protein HMPREF9699_02118 [Bergeyella zoohelcum ATCC 43767]SUV65526.1 Sporulation initiation inhibitor protein soj [Bergeyella zoohelcum]VDH06586.1 plasmid partitioning protein [Bergeyella zoohelcum]
MPKFILSTHQKGGVGKSTLTFNLACVLNTQSKVAICDLDPQGTLASLKNLSEIPIYINKDLESLKSSDYDFVFIDTPPYLTNELPKLLKFMDAIIIPTKVGLADFMAITKTIEIIENDNKGNKAIIVLNMVKPNTKLTDEMKESLENISIKTANTNISDLVAFTRSLATNGVDDAKAQSQINDLLIEVLSILAN